MKAVVLVGGFGTRLRPLTLTRPKQMLPIVGRPMIEWVVGRLSQFGVDEVVLSLGYRPDAFVEAYPDGSIAGVDFTVAVEPEPLGTAGAVRFAASAAALDDTFLVLNGDVLTDLDVGALVSMHADRGGDATIALQRVDDPSRFGVVPTDADGRVLAFVEKPEPGTAPTDFINAGTYVLEPSVVERIPAGRPVSIERETFPELVDQGLLWALAAETYWLDTGTPAQFLEANMDLISGRRAGGSELLGGQVDPGADVSGSVIGLGSVVESGAVVRGSVLMSNVVVERNAQVTGSVIGEGVRIGEGAVVRDLSVIGDHEQIAPGVVLAGVRQPEPG